MTCKIVTSLSPHRIERQIRCIRSWRAYGLPIVAVQTTGEAAACREWMPNIEYIEVASKPNVFDKPYLPRVADILESVDFDCLLINADIEIVAPYKTFVNDWLIDRPDSLTLGLRHDYWPGKPKHLTPYGIDAFRITPDMRPHLMDEGFTIGMPGWDYWIPWRLWAAGYNARVAESALLHELHEMGWQDDTHGISGRQLLTDTCRMPTGVFTVFIQWITKRENLRRTPTAKKRRKAKR